MRAPGQRSIFGGDVERPRQYGKRFAGAPHGHAAPPGSGPPGETCGTCANCRIRRIHEHNVYKCAITESHWTKDRETDVLKSSPACARWHAGTPILINAFGKPI